MLHAKPYILKEPCTFKDKCAVNAEILICNLITDPLIKTIFEGPRKILKERAFKKCIATTQGLVLWYIHFKGMFFQQLAQLWTEPTPAGLSQAMQTVLLSVWYNRLDVHEIIQKVKLCFNVYLVFSFMESGVILCFTLCFDIHYNHTYIIQYAVWMSCKILS